MASTPATWTPNHPHAAPREPNRHPGGETPSADGDQDDIGEKLLEFDRDGTLPCDDLGIVERVHEAVPLGAGHLARQSEASVPPIAVHNHLRPRARDIRLF